MVNAKELKKENWVINNGQQVKILNGAFIDSQAKYCDPIPLSPEVLEACGFEKLPGAKAVYRKVVDSDLEVSVSIKLHFFYVDTTWGQASIKKPVCQSLHQLQNLYFALTGQELTYSSNSITG